MNTGDCMRVIDTPLTEAAINTPDYQEKELFRRACFDFLIAQRLNRQEQELINRSPDTLLANCVRMFFSIAADGTEYQLRPEYRKCGRSPDCAATLTLWTTDGTRIHKKKPGAG